MDLKIKDVSELLNIPQETIKKWVVEGEIPFYQIQQQIRFSRSEIENWVICRKNASSHENLSEDNASKGQKSGNNQFSLFRALHKGEVIHKLAGKTKKELIENTMKRVAKSLHVDEEVMTDLLLDREALSPTALNNGIAVPHTRDSLINSPHDIVITAFLETPLDYGALDGKPVHTLFFLFACEDKRHLHLLSKIAHLSSQEQSLSFIQSQPKKNTLLSFVKNWEAGIQQR